MALNMAKIEAERRRRFEEQQKQKATTSATIDDNAFKQNISTQPEPPVEAPSPVSQPVQQVAQPEPVKQVQSSEPIFEDDEPPFEPEPEFEDEDEFDREFEDEDDDPIDGYEKNDAEDALVDNPLDPGPAKKPDAGGTDLVPEDEGIESDALYQDDTSAYMQALHESRETPRQSSVTATSVQPRPQNTVSRTERPVQKETKPVGRIPSNKGSNRIRKTEPARPASVRNDPVATVRIPEFPRSLIQEVRNIYKDATTNSDALAAFVYAQLANPDLIVSDNVRQLVHDNDADNTLVNVEQRMRHLEEMIYTLSDNIKELELALAFMIFDRVGFRKDVPDKPYDVNILEAGVNDVIKKIRESADKKKQWDNQTDGRPYR